MSRLPFSHHLPLGEHRHPESNKLIHIFAKKQTKLISSDKNKNVAPHVIKVKIGECVLLMYSGIASAVYFIHSATFAPIYEYFINEIMKYS